MALFELELGDAVSQESADAVGALEHGHRVPGAIELGRCGKTCRPRADDGDTTPRTRFGRLRGDPALIKRAVDDRHLDGFDRDRIVVDAEDARTFARRRAEPAGELRKVIRRMQAIDRSLPTLSVDEIVPVGDQISE